MLITVCMNTCAAVFLLTIFKNNQYVLQTIHFSQLIVLFKIHVEKNSTSAAHGAAAGSIFYNT